MGHSMKTHDVSTSLTAAVSPLMKMPVSQRFRRRQSGPQEQSEPEVTSPARSYPQGGILMSQPKPITDRVLEFLQRYPECEFEALVTRYPEFTWNELFLEVSRLNRTGQVRITRGVGIFTITQTMVMR